MNEGADDIEHWPRRPPQLIEAADTLTEMNAVRRAFQAGGRAQKGIEL